MAQHDYIIANQSGAAFRADLNNGLAAIVSQNSGAVQPSTTYAYQWWADTTTGLLKIRNAGNNGWTTVGTLASANLGLLAATGSTMTGALLLDDAANTPAAPALAFDGDSNTGIYRSVADALNVASGGVENVEFGTTEVVFNDTGADIDFRIEGDTNPNLFAIDAGTDEVRVANLNGGPLGGLRNRIINGDMRLAQRGTSFVLPTSPLYTLDRWRLIRQGTMSGTITQSTDVPANNTFQNSWRMNLTATDTSLTSTDQFSIGQRIEGFNVRDLIGTTFTLSFWVKSAKTGTHCVAFRNSTPDRSHVKEYTVTTANTWEYKSVTVTGGLITAGTWSWTSGIGLEVVFTLASSSTFHTTANAWNTGNFVATSSQVNLGDTIGNDFFLTGVQLEVGAVATPFERRSFDLELELGSRYFQIVTYYGGAYTSLDTCYFTPEGFNRLRANPTISVSVDGFQFFNNTTWTNINSASGASYTVYTSPIGTKAIQINGLTGNGATLPTPVSVAVLGSFSAEL